MMIRGPAGTRTQPLLRLVTPLLEKLNPQCPVTQLIETSLVFEGRPKRRQQLIELLRQFRERIPLSICRRVG